MHFTEDRVESALGGMRKYKVGDYQRIESTHLDWKPTTESSIRGKFVGLIDVTQKSICPSCQSDLDDNEIQEKDDDDIFVCEDCEAQTLYSEVTKKTEVSANFKNTASGDITEVKLNLSLIMNDAIRSMDKKDILKILIRLREKEIQVNTKNHVIRIQPIQGSTPPDQHLAHSSQSIVQQDAKEPSEMQHSMMEAPQIQHGMKKSPQNERTDISPLIQVLSPASDIQNENESGDSDNSLS